MNWQQIFERIKISIHLFGIGIDYNPKKSEATIANYIIKILEDRRVLIDPPFRTDISNCVKSIQEIRGMLTEKSTELSIGSKLVPSLQSMIAACRNFLSEVEAHKIPISSTVYELATEQASYFHIALGNLRATFGLHIGLIAARYKLDVHDDLASIVPNEEE